MNAAFVAAATRARLSGPENAEFERVGSDSRAAAGAVDLFVALQGERFDGNDFIDEAIRSGARGVLCARGRGLERPGVTFFEVDDTLRALGDLAAAHRRRFDVPVVAITGSNGKTTTKNLLRSILACAYGDGCVLATEGNLNNLIGMPLTLLRLASAHRAVILEMGMNAFGEIARLTEIASPTHGCITCVAPAHLEGVGSIEGVARAKGELFAGLSERATAVVNCDDPQVAKVAEGLRCRRVDFGAGKSIRAEDYEALGLQGSRFRLVLPHGSAEVRLPLLGSHNVANAVAAAACAAALGVATEAIVAGLSLAPPAPMRLSVERLPNGVDLINDAYNANPGSMRAALSAVGSLAARRLIVLGDMRELGEGAARLHAEVGAAAALTQPRLLCALGENAGHLVRGAIEAGLAPERALAATSHADAAERVASVWQRGDTVLVKGSRGSRMEEVVVELRERARS